MPDLALLSVIAIVVLALVFDFTNGFHDAANSIATVVSTRVLTPRMAVIWAALRFGPLGASLSLLVVSGLTVLNTARNTGPFVRESITDSLLSTQLFLATAALSSLILAAVTAERATAAAALRANEERLRSIVRCMAEGLIVRDDGGVITECNAVAERLIGLSRDRLLGRRVGDVIGPTVGESGEPLPGGPLLGDRALTDGASESGTVARVTRPDGTAAWVSASWGPVRDAAGRIAGVVTSLNDITSRRAHFRVDSTSSVTHTRTNTALVVSRGPAFTCARASATACAPIQFRQTPSATSPPALSICSPRSA